MKSKEKEKVVKVQPKDSDSMFVNELTSRKEVGVQDNRCVATMNAEKKQTGESISAVLDKLVDAVDSVAGKLGGIESRLTAIEEEVSLPKMEHQDTIAHAYPDVPLIQEQNQITDSDLDAQSKKKRMCEKGPSCREVYVIRSVNNWGSLSDKTVIERKVKPAATVMMAEAGVLLQAEGPSGEQSIGAEYTTVAC